MAKNLKKTNLAVNAEGDALAPLFNGGKLKLYTGAQPATADTAIGAQVLCAQPTFGNPAFGATAAGVMTANAITADPNAAAAGKVTWARSCKADNSAILDQAVGMKLTNTDISFVSGTKKINKVSGGWNSTNLQNGDAFTVAGSASNNGTYTVASYTDTDITVNEALVNEAAGANITVSEIKDIIMTNVNVQIGIQVNVGSYVLTIAKS